MMHDKRLALAAAIALAVAGTLAAGEPFTGWKTASTRHFRFIYEDAGRAQAEAFAKIADAAWNEVSSAYSTPPELTDVTVTARTDTVNAFAEGLNRSISLYTVPPTSPEFGFRDSWERVFFTHELIHIANFAFEGKSHPAADLFGPLVHYFDLADIEPWYVEGLTTVLETELTSGGRGRSPFFELYYKAPAIEDSFIAYSDIGAEREAPRGQIYVMGYLIMRSIADRFGLDALADIERNRNDDRDFDESVELVTGMTGEQLYRDARISLAKKYAKERAIPEGKTVTPRDPNTYYYRPALVAKDGMITLRAGDSGDMAAVRINPSTGEEKTLFAGPFVDEYALAASEDGTIVAAMTKTKYDAAPGYAEETDLYRWSKKDGLKKLTDGVSLFQPTLSRSGNRLVAVELAGARYRLVEISLADGGRTVLAESATESYIEPTLSADGAKVAFLSVDGSKATLCSAIMPPKDSLLPLAKNGIERTINATGPIVDVANPSWTPDGKLLYAANARGRLEIFELRDGKGVPVLADPVGATWANVTDEGIWYASYAGTGNVVKIKPRSSWGDVPSFDGPSAPGEIVSFGALAADYEGFSPFSATEEHASDAGKKKKDTAQKRGAAGTRTETQDYLGAETRFGNAPKLLFWMPIVSCVSDGDGSSAFGIGAAAIFAGHQLQNGMAGTELVLGGSFYPGENQLEGFALAGFPFLNGEVTALGQRRLSADSEADVFSETNSGRLSLSLPLEATYFYFDHVDCAIILGGTAVAGRSSDSMFPASSSLPFERGLSASAGLDFSVSSRFSDDLYGEMRATASVIPTTFPTSSGTAYLASEGSFAVTIGDPNVLGEFSVRSRWFDFPEDAPAMPTLANLRGEELSYLYPGRTILGASIIVPFPVELSLFAEKLISSGVNSAGLSTPRNDAPYNIEIDPAWFVGTELSAGSGRNRVAVGITARLDSHAFDPADDLQLYLALKMDAIGEIWR